MFSSTSWDVPSFYHPFFSIPSVGALTNCRVRWLFGLRDGNANNHTTRLYTKSPCLSSGNIGAPTTQAVGGTARRPRGSPGPPRVGQALAHTMGCIEVSRRGAWPCAPTTFARRYRRIGTAGPLYDFGGLVQTPQCGVCEIPIRRDAGRKTIGPCCALHAGITRS